MRVVQRFAVCLLSLLVASAVWLPFVHVWFRPNLEEYCSPTGTCPKTDALTKRQVDLWSAEDGLAGEIEVMRQSNPEWDLMGRKFLVMSLANLAIRYPERRAEYLAVMDRIIDDTLRAESEHGMHHFLMGYASRGSFVVQPPRSLFVDGQIATMMASRQLVQAQDRYAPLLANRVDTMISQMQAGPVGCAESYPNECWMFCNSVAVAAVCISDAVDGRDHSAFIQDWLARVRQDLIDPATGLLVSSFEVDGQPLDGPEGSSIWMVAERLRFVDEDFACDQYRRAKAELGVTVCGFGFAREWPKSWRNGQDIDSGPVIPLLGVSPGSSGLALLGAGAFGDRQYLSELLTTVQFAAFPIHQDDGTYFAASNQVGDAVMLYACVQGPLLERVAERNAE